MNSIEIARAHARLEGWSLTTFGEAIEKTFIFDDFKQAFAFMTRAAEVAEKLDHPPDWRNAYNQVHVRLSTHEAQQGQRGLTALDFTLAAELDALE